MFTYNTFVNYYGVFGSERTSMMLKNILKKLNDQLNRLETKHKIMLIIVGICLFNILVCGSIFFHYHQVEQRKQELMLNMEQMREHNHTDEDAPIPTIPPQEKPEIKEDDIVSEVMGYLFIERIEEMYVNRPNMEVKSLPGYEADTLFTFQTGDKIKQLAVSYDIDWIQVKVDDTIGYVEPFSIGEEFVYDETVYNEMLEHNSSGRLYIDDLKIDTMLIMPEGVLTGEAYGKISQWIVDRKDASVLLKDTDNYYGQLRMADHNIHGWDQLKKCEENVTTALWHQGTHVIKLICVKNFTGYNLGSDLTDLNGQSIAGQNNYGVCMYSCNRDGTVMLTYWQVVDGDYELK